MSFYQLMNKSFTNILQKHAKTSNIVYPDSPDYWLEIDREKATESTFYLYFMMSSNETTKYQQFHKIHTNLFIQTHIRNEIFEIFSNAQRTYYALSKIARQYKMKHTKMNMTTDLYMNEIDPRHKNSICIHRSSVNYWFSIPDLANHIESALTNSPYYYAEPLAPKNPYTNLPFTDADLYNIYFHMKTSNHLFPMIFHGFVMSELDLERFRIDYECQIRDTFLKKHVYNMDKETLFTEMRAMLVLSKIRVHPTVPHDDLINIMRPYFYLYMVSLYHICGLEKQSIAHTVLRRKLNKLRIYNPVFGRLIIHPRKFMTPVRREYNMLHPKFTMRDALNIR